MTPHDAGAILQAEIERLRAALRWYADAENYAELGGSSMFGEPPDKSEVQEDRGRRAREALGLIETDASADN